MDNLNDKLNYEYFRIVAWNTCPWCRKAEDLLREEGLEFHISFHERDTPALNEAKERNNWQTVPMVTHVKVDGDEQTETFLGGYTDLHSYIEKTRKNGG